MKAVPSSGTAFIRCPARSLDGKAVPMSEALIHPVAADGSEPQHLPAKWSTLAAAPNRANVVVMDAKREAGAA